MLLPLHLWLVLPLNLILKPYPLLLPPAHGVQGNLTLLLHHCNVKYWPCGVVLCHLGVAAGYILPNWLQPRFRKCLTNWEVLPAAVPTPRHLAWNPSHHMIIEAPKRLQNLGCDNPRLWHKDQQRLQHHHVKPHRGSVIHPPLGTVDRRTGPI